MRAACAYTRVLRAYARARRVLLAAMGLMQLLSGKAKGGECPNGMCQPRVPAPAAEGGAGLQTAVFALG